MSKRMASGIFWVGATKALSQGLSWVITIVVVRILSPEDYGLMGMTVLLTSFLFLFNEMGLGTAIVQRESITPEELSSIHWVVVLLNVGIFGLTCISAPIVSLFFKEPRLTNLIRVAGLSFLVNAFGLISNYMLLKKLSFKEKSQAELLGSLSGSVSTLALAFGKFGVWSLVGGYLVQETVRNVAYIAFCPINFMHRFSFGRIRNLVRFGIQIAVARVLWYISSNADFIIAGRLLGKTLLGYYTLAFQFASIPIDKIVTIVTQVALPSFSEIQNDEPRLQRYYLKMTKIIAFVTFPMFLGLFLVADSAVVLFMTEKWRPVIFPLKVLSLVSCLRAVETLNAPLIIAKGRPRIVLYNNLLQAIVLPSALFIGARYGLAGLSISWLIAWPFLYLVITSQALRLIGLSFGAYFANIRHVVIGSVGMVIVCAAAKSGLPATTSHAVSTLAISGLGMIFYLLYTLMFNKGMFLEAIDMVRSRR